MMIFSQISQSSRGNYDDFSEISRSSGILFKKKTVLWSDGSRFM